MIPQDQSSNKGGTIKPLRNGDGKSSISLPEGPFSGIYTRVDADTIFCVASGMTLRKARSSNRERYGSAWFLQRVFANGGHRFISTLWGNEFEAGSLRYKIADAGNDQLLITVIRKVKHRRNQGGKAA